MTRRHQETRGSTVNYLDLFHLAHIDSWPRGDFRKTGDASTAVDRGIGRVVVRLAGTVPAANSLRLPARQEDSLGAAGRFLYLQLRLEVGKPYAIHADFSAADRGLHRVSVSNLYAAQQAVRMKRSGVQVFLPVAHDRWTLLALNLGALAQQASSSPYARLRTLHMCANMTVRGAFTSDVRYDWQSLPADLCFTAAFDVTQAQVLWVPEEPCWALVAAPKRPPTSSHPPLPRWSLSCSKQRRQPANPGNGDLAGTGHQQQLELQPTPIAQLQRVSAFSGSRGPALLHWVPSAGADAPEEIVFGAGTLIISMQPLGGQQRHLLGHTGVVRALALSVDGGRLASAEEGPGAVLRLWDFRQGRCLATVPGHAGGALCLDLSPDGRLLATAGVDAQGRQELVWWDVSGCWALAGCGGAVELARQVSEYNMQAVKFLPYDPNRLVTCGKNSIRTYRLKAGQLRGMSVPMEGVQALRQPYSCGTLANPAAAVGEVFTCMAFEHTLRVRPLQARRLYVGSLSGALYTVSLEGWAVEGVAQLHSGVLSSLAVHDGFCVSGSTDCLLRVWGSDLREVYMEAQHEGAVTGIGLSPDGLRVAVGTDSGALSLLDIASQAYTTLLRSHTAAVHAVALVGQERRAAAQYVTAGADGTVRVWDTCSHQQVLELCVPGETVLSATCHPSKPEVACGFQGGNLRIFDASSAALVQESQQHSGAISQLVYARHGRLLLSLGDDGCVCVYDAERSYMPTTFIQAGFPLHATAMSASQDGKLLAVSSLTMCSTNGSGASVIGRGGPATSDSSSSAGAPQPAITLYDLVSLQPMLQLPVIGRSHVVQLQLLLDGKHVLAMTAEGRLLGYSCVDGSLVLDVPRCLAGACSAMALDPSGSFLVASSLEGQIMVWGLDLLLQQQQVAQPRPVEAAASAIPGVVSCLPSQQLSAPAGCAVLDAVFAGSSSSSSSLQLLTVGEQGNVCCWSFHGKPASSQGGAEALATASTTKAPAQEPQSAEGAFDTGCPIIHLSADCTSAAPVAPPVPDHRPEVGLGQSSPVEQATPKPAALSPDSPAPRPLPAVLQLLPPRPPSAPAALPRQLAALTAVSGPAAHVRRQPSASLPATPLHGSRKEPLCWGQAEQAPEASLLITATHLHRCTQVVRQQKQLRITSPYKVPGVSVAKQLQRTAAWVDDDVAGDHIPPYHPSQQLRLLPPAAAVRHVQGFDAGAGFHLQPASQDQERQEQQVVYAAGNILLAWGLPGQQRQIARLPRNVSALAVHGDLIAAAVQPAPGDGSTADVHLVGLQSGMVQAVLSHHSYAVERMSFSPDGSLLVTLSSGTSGLPPSTSLALWAVGQQGVELVAGVQLPVVVAGLTWRAGIEQPTFYTVSSQGLAEWQLEPEALGSTGVHLPTALRGQVLVAAACVTTAEGASGGCYGSRWHSAQEQDAAVFVGDKRGRIWRLLVDDGQDGHSPLLLAELQGQPVSCIAATGQLCAVGTAAGSLLLLAEEGRDGRAGSWRMVCCEQLDGPVISLQVDAGSRSVAAATACGTLWQVAAENRPSVLLCGQQQHVRSWHMVPGTAWKGTPPTSALASAAGLAIWQLGEDGSQGTKPLVEFCQPADATHASLADDGSCCAAAYRDGSICLFDMATASMRWKSAGAVQHGGVVALAVVQRLRGIKVMAAYRSGALCVLDGAIGQIVHRSMQFAVVQDSGRRCPSNFPLAGLALCPTDSAVFALCGQQELVVCQASWTKNAGVQTLARLSFAPTDAVAPPAAMGAPSVAASEPAVHIAFSRAHRSHLYCTNPADPGQLLLFDYATVSVIKTLLAPLVGCAGITALALHPKEELLAVGTTSGSVLLLRLETEAWAELSAHAAGQALVGLAFSACGRKLFTAAGTAIFTWHIQESC